MAIEVRFMYLRGIPANFQEKLRNSNQFRVLQAEDLHILESHDLVIRDSFSRKLRVFPSHLPYKGISTGVKVKKIPEAWTGHLEAM